MVNHGTPNQPYLHHHRRRHRHPKPKDLSKAESLLVGKSEICDEDLKSANQCQLEFIIVYCGKQIIPMERVAKWPGCRRQILANTSTAGAAGHLTAVFWPKNCPLSNLRRFSLPAIHMAELETQCPSSMQMWSSSEGAGVCCCQVHCVYAFDKLLSKLSLIANFTATPMFQEPLEFQVPSTLVGRPSNAAGPHRSGGQEPVEMGRDGSRFLWLQQPQQPQQPQHSEKGKPWDSGNVALGRESHGFRCVGYTLFSNTLLGEFSMHISLSNFGSVWNESRPTVDVFWMSLWIWRGQSNCMILWIYECSSYRWCMTGLMMWQWDPPKSEFTSCNWSWRIIILIMYASNKTKESWLMQVLELLYQEDWKWPTTPWAAALTMGNGLAT